ncbi:MAG: AraC family transcriptional regulator [Bacteroidota bacterium]
MTFYEKEILRIKGVVYSNQGQIDTAIRTRSYIEEHYNRDLNLDLLAQHLFVSKYHLLRLFKKYYGQTPRQYLINKRIEQAKEHLKNGLSVTEACFAVGFESVGSFSSLFKRKTGQTPAQFKKSNFREAT